MTSETKTCQNCKQSFIIEPDDFSFYEKMQVPPPTWCPECRMIRRMAFRDYRVLYKRKSDHSGEMIFSVFNPKSPLKVWERDYWWSDAWDAFDYGKEVDFSRPFLEQLRELSLKVPVPSQTAWNLVNSDYCAGSNNLKDCYLTFVATGNENCAYAAEINQVKNSFDITRTDSSELCYQSFALIKCYKTFFSSHCESCNDVWFSRNLSGCSSCFGCVNLRNKQYYIFNQSYSKEEYEKKIKEFNVGSHESFMRTKEVVAEFLSKNIRRFVEGRHNTNVSGEYINNSKNLRASYYVNGSEDGKYLQLFFTPSSRDCYDCTLWGENVEQIYECSSIGSDSYNVKFSCRCYKGARNCEYALYDVGCSNIFGCVGLRNKSYCILNKQYSEGEYEALVPKIKKHMDDMPYTDAKGRSYKYGEFFPPEFGFFGYNETLAQDYFPLSSEEAKKNGYPWYEQDDREYSFTKKTGEIPDAISDISESALKEIFECAHKGKCNHQCTGAFKVIPQEFEFYKRFSIPFPKMCPNCRHYERIQERNSIKLWHRICQCAGIKSGNGVYMNTAPHQHGEGKCPNEFETSYAPARPEIVYCEQCYQSEVV